MNEFEAGDDKMEEKLEDQTKEETNDGFVTPAHWERYKHVRFSKLVRRFKLSECNVN